MEPVALSPIKRRGTAAPPALKDSASAPSFSNHFKARIDQVSTRRNEQTARHASMVRLGALKHHAKVMRHRENKEAEHAVKRERAHEKDLARARRRRELEGIATRRHAERVEDLVAQNKLPAMPRDAGDRIFVRYCPVAGFETVHKKLQPKTLKPLRQASSLPENRHVLHRDRMAEAALAEKCHGVPMSQRLFSHNAHAPKFCDRNLTRAEIDAEAASHDENVPILDTATKVVLKAQVPRYKKKEYLDTANEFAVLRHIEKYSTAHRRTELRQEARMREAAENISDMAALDRFAEKAERAEKVERAEREVVPPVAVTGGSAWQRSHPLPTWAVDSSVYLGA